MGISAAVATFAGGLGASAATAAVVGSVVSGAVIGAGVSGAVAAVTGGDIGDAMLAGALTGGIAGPISGAIGAVAPGAAAVGSVTNAVATGAVIGAGTAAVQGGDILEGALIGGAGAGLGKLASNTLDDILGASTGAMPSGGSAISPDDLLVNNTTSGYAPTNTNLGGYVGSTLDDAALAGTSGYVPSNPNLGGYVGSAGIDATDDLIQQAMKNGGILPDDVTLTSAPMPTADIRPVTPGASAFDVEDLKQGIAAGSPAITGNAPASNLQNAGDVLRAAQGGVDEVIDAAIPTTAPTTPTTNTFDVEDLKQGIAGGSPAITSNQPAAGGTTTQTFSDGSTLTTNAAGEIIEATAPAATTTPTTPRGGAGGFVDSSGNLYDEFGNPTKNLSGGYVDKSGMVYDEFGNPAGKLNGTNNTNVDFSGVLNSNGTITRLDGSNTVIDTTGRIVEAPSGVNAGVIGGSAAGAMSIPKQQTQPQGFGESSWSWGTVPQIVQPGLNPGAYARSVKPMYPDAAPGQSQYYWGAQQYAPTSNEARFYNMGTNAPAEPFGAAMSAVGGTDSLDIGEYVNQFMTPQRQQAVTGSQPQFVGSTGINPLVGAPVMQQPVTIQPTVLPIAPTVPVTDTTIPVEQLQAQQVLEPVAP